MHTEAFGVSDPSHIAEVTDTSDVVRTYRVPLPFAENAMARQQDLLGTGTGRFGYFDNNCLTHCADVLEFGGVVINGTSNFGAPTSLEMLEWLKRL
jgi:hypothetical protein